MPRAIVFLTLLAGCGVELAVPEGASIECRFPRDCPEGYTCVAKECIPADTNIPTRAIMEPVPRQVAEVEVQFHFVDAESEQARIRLVDYKIADGEWLAATFEADDLYETSPEGVPGSFVWRADVDLVSLNWLPEVRLRVTPSTAIAGGEIAESESEPFQYGNSPPVISDVSIDDDPVRGKTVVRFTVSDDASDTVWLEAFQITKLAAWEDDPDPYSPELTGGAGNPFPSGALAGLATSVTGVTHSITWDSMDFSLIGQDNKMVLGALMRLRVADRVDEVTQVSEWQGPPAFDIDNSSPPSLVPAYVKSEVGVRSGVIPIVYTAYDDQSDTISIDAEYSLDDGQSWYRCTEYRSPKSEGTEGLDSDFFGIEHIYMWDSTADIFGARPALVRITGMDEDGRGLGTLALAGGIIGPPNLPPTASMWTAASYQTNGNDVNSCVVGDFNNDGRIDVAANRNNGIQAYLGQPGGGMVAAAANATTTSSFVDHLHVVDLTGDGFLDVYGASSDDVVVFVGNGDGTFGSAIELGTDPDTALTVAHGRLTTGSLGFDLVAFDWVAAELRMHPITGVSNGNPVFGASRVLLSGGGVSDVDIADFDGDGWDDLAIAHGSPNLWLLWGADDYATIEDLPTGAPVSGVLAEDLDGDGLVDLAASQYENASVALLRGRGDGTWESPVVLSGRAVHLEAGDVNSDGLTDVVLQHAEFWKSNQYQFILANNHPESFASRWMPPYSLAVGEQRVYGNYPPGMPDGVAVADFDGDGLNDFAATDGSHIWIMTAYEPSAIGPGSFSTPVRHPVGLPPTAVAAGDLDSDGVIDLAVASDVDVGMIPGTDRARIGLGGFAPGVRLPVAPQTDRIEIGEVTGDGLLDIIAAHDSGAVVLPGDGSGGFGAAISCPAGGNVYDMAAADFNHDGRLDLAFAMSSTSLAVLLSVDAAAGQCPFSAPVAVSNGQTGVTIETGDFDRDGHVDIAVVTYNTGLQSYRNDGDGNFSLWHAVDIVTNPPQYRTMSVADVNSDRILDVLTFRRLDDIEVATGNGDGSFDMSYDVPGLDDTYWDFVVADLNRDGNPDIVSVIETTTEVCIDAGDGAGGFAGDHCVDMGARISAVAVADVNNDEALDIIGVSESSSEAIVLYGHQSRFRRNWARVVDVDHAVGAILPETAGDLSVPALNSYSQRPFYGDPAGGRPAVHLGPSGLLPSPSPGAIQSFADMSRQTGIIPPSANEVTGAWYTTGDKRLTRVIVDEPRLKVEARFGWRRQADSATDYDRVGLNLLALPPRGIIVDLPLIEGVAAPGPFDNVIVVSRVTDWWRADELCEDINGPATCQDGTTPSTHQFLGRTQDGEDIVRERYIWQVIPRDLDDDFDSDPFAGKRFRVDGDNDRIQVLTDQLGVFQAFLVP